MRIHTHLAWTIASLLLATAPAIAQLPAPAGGGVSQGGRPDLERLRSQLAQPGPEGSDARETAVEQLLSSSDERAHQILAARLSDAVDTDGVRLQVMQALARRLINPLDPVFGQRPETAEVRGKIVRRYVQTLVGFWVGEVDGDGLLPPDPLRDVARQCIVRLPASELSAGLRAIVQAPDAQPPARIAALRTAGDSQSLQQGLFLADFVEAADPAIQEAAREALRHLTFVEAPFERKEQYQAWHKQNGSRRYLDLAEEAARAVATRARQFRVQLTAQRRDDAAEYVRAVTERRNGTDWAAVQSRVLGDEVETTRLCLGQLQRTLAEAVPAEDAAPARVAFARAVLQRYRATLAADTATRAALLEVSAYLCRPSETELAAEVVAELVPMLACPSQDLQLAALRGIRRFPSQETRSAVTQVAAEALLQAEARTAVLTQALQTLSWSKDTPWRAPHDGAVDKASWLQLVRDVCGGSLPKERRTEGLAIALLLDRDNRRVPEVFDLLLDLARDRTKEPQFRTQCLIRLQDWRDQEARADALVRELSFLLADDERDVRLYAAESLARLPEASEERKRAWQRSIVLTLRERMRSEANAAVLRAMVDCLVTCGRDPGSPEIVIGALHYVLDAIGLPVPQDQQMRAQTLLSVLPAVAADPRTDVGQWIGASEMLLRHEERRSLRHVLESHNAVLLSKDFGSSDPSTADRAKKVMRLLLLAALLKPGKESWDQSEELKREAEDVRTVFAVLPPRTMLPENLQDPPLRLLRLEVLVAGGRTQEALALAASFLAEVDPKDHKPMDAAQLDAVRILAAEASLQDNKAEQAADWLSQVDAARATEPRALDVAERTSRAFANANPAKAVVLLDRILRATPPEDPLFRQRLVALLTARLRANPESRAEVLAEVNRHAALFVGPDCPEELKAWAAQLRSGGK